VPVINVVKCCRMLGPILESHTKWQCRGFKMVQELYHYSFMISHFTLYIYLPITLHIHDYMDQKNHLIICKIFYVFDLSRVTEFLLRIWLFNYVYVFLNFSSSFYKLVFFHTQINALTTKKF
jgi:hypothetical protein